MQKVQKVQKKVTSSERRDFVIVSLRLFVPKSAMLFDPLTHYLHKYINGDHDLNIRCYEKRKSVN